LDAAPFLLSQATPVALPDACDLCCRYPISTSDETLCRNDVSRNTLRPIPAVYRQNAPAARGRRVIQRPDHVPSLHERH